MILHSKTRQIPNSYVLVNVEDIDNDEFDENVQNGRLDRKMVSHHHNNFLPLELLTMVPPFNMKILVLTL